jgi:hypothetical protein
MYPRERKHQHVPTKFVHLVNDVPLRMLKFSIETRSACAEIKKYSRSRALSRPRGDAASVVGIGERQARRVISALVKRACLELKARVRHCVWYSLLHSRHGGCGAVSV